MAWSQVAIPQGMPFLPGVQQAQVHQPLVPKDFRSIDFEVGPASNRSSMLMSVGEGNPIHARLVSVGDSEQSVSVGWPSLDLCA